MLDILSSHRNTSINHAGNKVWHSYIMKFLDKLATGKNATNYFGHLGFISRESNDLGIFANTLENSTKTIGHCHGTRVCQHKSVVSPIGHIAAQTQAMVDGSTMTCNPCAQTYSLWETQRYCFLYKSWLMNEFFIGWAIPNGVPQMGLNISFLDIDISVRSQFYCKHRHLKVSQNNPGDFKFCGKWPQFNLHLPFNVETNVVIFYTKYGEGKFKGFYSVIDSGIVHSHPTEMKLPVFCAAKLLVHNKSSLLQFHIIVHKTFRIVVNWNRTEASISGVSLLAVADGPGLLSSSVEENEGKYQTTGFLCAVLVCKNDSFETPPANFKFDYQVHGHDGNQSTSISDAQNVSIDYSSFNKSHKNQVRILSIQSNQSSQVNISVTSIIFEGIASSSCLHGGLAVYELEHYELNTLCYTSTEGFSINHYVHKAIVIYYWFHSYSQLTVTMGVKISACSVVSIDPCKIRRRCSSTDKTECSEYLSLLNTKATSLSIFQGDRIWTEINYSVTTRAGCAVIQLRQGSNTTETEQIDNCFMRLTQAPSNLQDVVLNHVVFGSLDKSVLQFDYAKIEGTHTGFCIARGLSKNISLNNVHRLHFKDLSPVSDNKGDAASLCIRTKNRDTHCSHSDWFYHHISAVEWLCKPKIHHHGHIAQRSLGATFHTHYVTNMEQTPKFTLKQLQLVGLSRSWVEIFVWFSSTFISSQNKTFDSPTGAVALTPPPNEKSRTISLWNSGAIRVDHIKSFVLFLKLDEQFFTIWSENVDVLFEVEHKGIPYDQPHAVATEIYNRAFHFSHTIFHCPVTLKFGRHFSWHYLSLFWPLNSVSWALQNIQNIKKTATGDSDTSRDADNKMKMQLVWKNDMFTHLLSFQGVPKCTTLPPTFFNSNLSFCLNYSKSASPSFNTNFYFIFLMRKFNPLHYNTEAGRLRESPERFHVAWLDASTMCVELGGDLPRFHSVDEVHALLALLIHSQKTHPPRAIFIGMQQNGSNQVCIVEFAFCAFQVI